MGAMVFTETDSEVFTKDKNTSLVNDFTLIVHPGDSITVELH